MPADRQPTRRQFLARSAGASALLMAGDCPVSDGAPPDSSPLLNPVGFAPRAGKVCVLSGRRPGTFSIVAADTGRVEYRGRLSSRNGDLGEYLQADFSDLRNPGRYLIRIGEMRSNSFALSDDVYDDALRKSVVYFSRQRCGDSKSGHHTPCHLDDGRRTDNGQHHDATGGWHDACDVRKWVNATIYGMLGLLRVLENPPPTCPPAALIEELRWGNQYFLKMQEPPGYLMDFCGGNTGNWYTDNRIGTADDRPVQTRVCELPAQFHFVTAQAGLIRHLRNNDIPYAARCETAARKCFRWCTAGRHTHTSTSLAAAVLACVGLHRTFEEPRFAELAGEFASRLSELQVTHGPVQGFFLRSFGRPDPVREIMYGNLPLLALCEILERFDRFPARDQIMRSLQAHIQYLREMTARSAFGTVPFGLYAGADPGGDRRIGNYWYRWFMRPHGENPASPQWWVGINAHLTSNGIGLLRAGRLLGDSSLERLAQRQLDWVLGVNPLAASTITGVGHNQPPLFKTDEFKPPTPLIPGGVMNGLGGDENDQLVLLPGSYHTCEYWTPMVAYAMWLMMELTRGPSMHRRK